MSLKKGIILHGGHGTRLRPLTHTGPKQLLPIANKPMSQYCVESMIKAGIKEIAFIIGGVGAEKVKEFYGSGEKFGVKFTYVFQESPKGIAHAIRLCKEFVENEKFLVFLGDNIIQKSIKEYAENFTNTDFEASILLCEVDEPSRFGIANIIDKKITQIVEKPKNPPTNLAVTGIYFLTPTIFDIIDNLKPSWRNELEITDALQMLLDKDYKINYETITNYWKDTGTPEDIIHANKVILENSSEFFQGVKSENVVIEGKVLVGEGTKIKDNAVIKGPVIIGKDCTIEGSSQIGPNSSIGDDCKISCCNIKDSIVMSNCEISEKIKIRNSIIASNSSIKINENKEEKIFLVGEGTKIFL